MFKGSEVKQDVRREDRRKSRLQAERVPPQHPRPNTICIASRLRLFC
jgi:hypothetical protein